MRVLVRGASALLSALTLSVAAIVIAPSSTAAGLPDLVSSTPGSVQSVVVAGGAIGVSTKIKNTGSKSAAGTRTAFYLSRDAKLDKKDVLLGKQKTGSLAPNKSRTIRLSATVPTGVAPASYRVLACADATMAVRESREGNNCKASSGSTDVHPATFTGTASGAVDFGAETETWSAAYVMTATYDDGLVSYDVTSGSMEWEISGSDSDGCTYAGTQSFDVAGDLAIHDSPGTRDYSFRIYPSAPLWASYDVTCPVDGYVETLETPFHGITDAAKASGQPYASGQTTLAGSLSFDSVHSEEAGFPIPVTLTWSMQGG